MLANITFYDPVEPGYLGADLGHQTNQRIKSEVILIEVFRENQCTYLLFTQKMNVVTTYSIAVLISSLHFVTTVSFITNSTLHY